MTKILFTCVASLAMTAAVYADSLKDNVGIGLGTMIFDGNDGLISQISAATTNGILGNQTFAISSGTSGAKPFNGFAQNRRMINEFVRDNMDVLAREMAAGKGESVDTLAELMNVSADQRAEFAKTLQANFGQIFTSANITNDQVVENLAKFAPQA